MRSPCDHRLQLESCVHPICSVHKTQGTCPHSSISGACIAPHTWFSSFRVRTQHQTCIGYFVFARASVTRRTYLLFGDQCGLILPTCISPATSTAGALSCTAKPHRTPKRATDAHNYIEVVSALKRRFDQHPAARSAHRVRLGQTDARNAAITVPPQTAHRAR